MILLIDNYDSFTYNLYQLIASCGVDVIVKRNDEISILTAYAAQFKGMVISPGPCTPNEAGVSLAMIKEFSGKMPILGICLGHQCLAQIYGAQIVQAPIVVHGKVSNIHHNEQGIFKGVPQNFKATRYHSLVVEESTLPDCFAVTATAPDKTIMAIQHKTFPSTGLQFHPESIMTEHGTMLMQNFLKGCV